MRKIPARVGVTDLGPSPLQPDNEAITFRQRTKDAILAAVKEPLTPEQAASLIEEIEFAVNMAIIRDSGWKVSRATILGALRSTHDAAEKMVLVLDSIPDAGRRYFRQWHGKQSSAIEMSHDREAVRRNYLSWGEARQQASDILTAAARAADEAREQFSGGGKDPDPYPALLARDVADALGKVGIGTPVSRPKDNRAGEVSKSTFWAVTEICFNECQFACKDLHSTLRAALKIKIEA